MNSNANTARPPATWAALTRLRPLRPVRDAADYAKARGIIDRLAVLGEDGLTRDQSDYLEALTLLFADYERTHHEIDASHIGPLEALRFLLQENGMNASDLGRLLGNRPLGSAILRGERQLSKTHMAILAERFAVEPGLFLATAPRPRARRARRAPASAYAAAKE